MTLSEQIKQKVQEYWRTHPDYAREACALGIDIASGQLPVRGVMFDMDGVLFDSMGFHAQAWIQACHQCGLNSVTADDVYLNEGRTALTTIEEFTQREWGRSTYPEEVERIYGAKCDIFSQFPEAPKMPGAEELVRKIKATGRNVMVVTGSGQESLLKRLTTHYPGCFVNTDVVSGEQTRMVVSSLDVQYGKPHPEPYLKGLAKMGLHPWEAIVVENAPLGTRAAVSAGVFTITVNTGPLDDCVLWDEGASLVFPSMPALNDAWETLLPHL